MPGVCACAYLTSVNRALRGGFARTQVKDPIKTELHSVLFYVTFPHDLALFQSWPLIRSDSYVERDSFRGKKAVLKIKLLGKWLNQEISGDRGSC